MAADARDGGNSMIRRAQPLLGTFVEVAVAGASPSASDAAICAAFAAIAQAHALMSFHEPHSDVSRLNNDAAADAVQVHDWTFQVLQAAADLHRRSNGLFNVAVAPMLQRLGLLPASGAECAEFYTLDQAADAIELCPDRHVRFRQTGVRIDLGGIAKGFAVDRAVDALRDHGVATGLVNAGGDLAAFGPDAQTIYIRDPCNPAALTSHVAVRNQALASTAGHVDPFETRNVADCAVIDPRSGGPVRAVRGASVRAPSCMIADALTKVVMIAQEDAGPLLDHFGASAMFVARNGEVHATADWRDAINLAP
jgi:FAD:protein FMN transferase